MHDSLSSLSKSFSFIMSFIVTMHVMSIIKPLSIKLQYKSGDIVYEYSKVSDVREELSRCHANDGLLHTWYVQAETLAAEVNVVPQVPQTTGQQCHRDNPEHAPAEEYYRRIITIPLLDNIKYMNGLVKLKLLFSNFVVLCLLYYVTVLMFLLINFLSTMILSCTF